MSKTKKAVKILGWIFVACIVIITAALIIRINQSLSTNVLSSVIVTDNIRNAYAEGKDLRTCHIVQEVSEDGNFRFYAVVYAPDQKELQVTAKYNKAVFSNLGIPTDEKFDFKLYAVTSQKEFPATFTERDEDERYGYCRMVFENVEIVDGDEDLEVVVMSADHEKEYSCFKIHETAYPFKDYKLSKGELEEITG